MSSTGSALAKIFRSCHSKRVKRILFFSFLFFVSLLTFLFLSVEKQFAGTLEYPSDCKCDIPAGVAGVGKNGFNCLYRGNRLRAWCDDKNKACFNAAPTEEYTGYHSDGESWQLPKGNDLIVIRGIKCERPGNWSTTSKPTLPPAAQPPCVKGAIGSDGRCTSISTSFGNFSTDPGAFILRVFGILLAISGAIALLLIMRAGYRIMTSRGNADGIKEGREQIVAAIVGLMFLIFSFVFLQVIAGDLLRIPSFTGPTGSTTGSCSASTGGVGQCISGDQCNARGGVDHGKLDCEGGGIVCCSPGGSTPGSCTAAGGSTGASCTDNSACPAARNLGKLDCEGGGVVCCKN